MARENSKSPDESDWAHRVLCSDEGCIGVIGPDGRCKECGLPYKGVLPWEIEGDTTTEPPGSESASDPSEETSEAEAPEQEGYDGDDDDLPVSDDDQPVSDDEWDHRVLCSDEGCIGVIGPDGRCKECGKPFRPE